MSRKQRLTEVRKPALPATVREIMTTDADLVSRNTRIEMPPITAVAEDGSVAELPPDFRVRLRHKVGTVAKDVMTTGVLTVGPDQEVEALAEIMVKNGVNMIPVVEKGRLVGVASRADVIRWMTREGSPVVKVAS